MSTNIPLPAAPREVIKRSGARVLFDPAKIEAALRRAGAATGEFDADESALLSAQVRKVLTYRSQGQAPHIEQIQAFVGVSRIRASRRREVDWKGMG